MTDTLRFGIIGTGAMAARMTRTLQSLPGVQVVGVASNSAERAETFARHHGIPQGVAGAALLLADPSLDAVYVGNANRDHAQAVRIAAAAGKAVLCEKPFALDLAEAEATLEAVRRSGILFMEAICTPFLPAYARLAARIAGGELGGPGLLQASFGYPEDPSLRPSLFAADAGVMLDRGIYPLATALLLAGPVARMQASVTRGAGGTDIQAALLLEHENGWTSQLAASLTGLLANEVRVSGPRASFLLPAPVMHPERLVAEQAPIPSSGSTTHAVSLKQKLKENPLLRRLKAALPKPGTEHLPYGSDHYRPEAEHFCGLLRAGQKQSPILPPVFSLQLQKLIAEGLRQPR
ncbi:Gfo/Idh/MocA family protein [Roseomonas sp. 18066]|uniref:Gfo/Idh/MocA family protein n=1 Tax=Roseomonas sp. 18066 TaxID=2681412 RepID=UPI00135AB522|nr:Gfo/Idh/MocA family oxidoreductase [Roseomonas sp. 18066]